MASNLSTGFKIPKSNELDKVSNMTLQESVTQSLKAALMSGHFSPGQTVTYRGLAEQLGTSVMPVREAVARLASSNALEILPNRSICVPRFSEQAFFEIWNNRKLLEGEVVSWAATKISKVDLDNAKSTQRKLVKSAKTKNIDEFLHHNHMFHFGIYRASEAEITISMIEHLWMLSGPSYRKPLQHFLNTQPDTIKESVSFHDQLLDALSQSDAELAMKIRKSDIDHMMTITTRYLNSQL